MAKPNTFRANVRERAQKAARRAIERSQVDETDLSLALSVYPTDTYNAFFGACREDGQSTERCGALWAILKERGRVSTGDTTTDMTTDNGTETATGRTADEGIAREPVSEAPETIEDAEQAISEADAAYLIVTDGCPGCTEAKREMKDWIDAGFIEVLNIMTSDKAADIAIEEGLEALPILVLEDDGAFTVL